MSALAIRLYVRGSLALRTAVQRAVASHQAPSAGNTVADGVVAPQQHQRRQQYRPLEVDVVYQESHQSVLPAWFSERGIHREPRVRNEFFVTDANEAVGDVTYAVFTANYPTFCYGSTLSKAVREALTVPVASKHPLLWLDDSAPATGAVVTEEDRLTESLTRHLSFPVQPGRVFVIEGGDGAGKETQCALLCKHLEADGYPVETMDFPHDDSRYGRLIRDILRGEMGDFRAINPLMFAGLFALNRHDERPSMDFWLLKGTNVVLDRYMTANFGHQAAKYKTDAERNAVIKTLHSFEVSWLKMPEPELVLYLNLSPKWSLEAMKADGTRRELDMHELAGLDYKDGVRKAFLWCCDTFSHQWREVKCVTDDAAAKESERMEDPPVGRRLTREEVHDKIWATVLPHLVNRRQ